MVEFFELISSYWNKSKEDWQQNRHRLFTLFGFVVVAYLVLEFGSYIFTSRLNQAKTIDVIRSKFIDRRVLLADEVLRKFYNLKENTRMLLEEIQKNKFTLQRCEKLKQDLNLAKIESDLFISSANMRYFFGDTITDEFVRFNHWYDENDNNCFNSISNAELEMDKKVISIRNKMWEKMYPPEIIRGLR